MTPEDKAEMVSKALTKAWRLGQVYWQHADSESYTKNKLASCIEDEFNTLIDEIRNEICTTWDQ